MTLLYPTMAQAMAHARRTAVAPMTWNPTDLLLSRFAFGPNSAMRATVAKWGPDAWYAQQVAYAKKYPIYAGNTAVQRYGTLLGTTPVDLQHWLNTNSVQFGWDAMDQLTRVTIGLQAWSGGQLYETLVDFFSNHLNVANHDPDQYCVRHAYDRDVIRRYAMGSFTDMLIASSKHPAMLQFLSLAESTKYAVNENYGRELLELHTVGLHYSENNVKYAAKLLTGRTYDWAYHYEYDPDIHATGAVQVLGFKHSNPTASGGEAAGDALLRYLAMHPYTAQHLAQKLCVRFVSDTPSANLVTSVANAYLASKTQILPMISTILRSTEFWESRGRKVKRPAENIISTVRVLDLIPNNMPKALETLHWATQQAGNVPLDWPYPNGYADTALAWRSSSNLLDEWSAHLALVYGMWPGLPAVNVPQLYAAATSTGAAASILAQRLTGSTWTSTALASIATFLGESLLTLPVLSTLRWLDAPLVAAMLHGPHHAMR